MREFTEKEKQLIKKHLKELSIYELFEQCINDIYGRTTEVAGVHMNTYKILYRTDKIMFTQMLSNYESCLEDDETIYNVNLPDSCYYDADEVDELLKERNK